VYYSLFEVDLTPLRVLVYVILGGEVVGAVAGVAVAPSPSIVWNALSGATFAMFPAFLVGLLVQSQAAPGRITENKAGAIFLGVLTFVITAGATLMLVPKLT
jgi:hypothetical protein